MWGRIRLCCGLSWALYDVQQCPQALPTPCRLEPPPSSLSDDNHKSPDIAKCPWGAGRGKVAPGEKPCGKGSESVSGAFQATWSPLQPGGSREELLWTSPAVSPSLTSSPLRPPPLPFCRDSPVSPGLSPSTASTPSPLLDFSDVGSPDPRKWNSTTGNQQLSGVVEAGVQQL